MCYTLKQKEDYLSKNNTIALKGVLAILIILHHLSLITSVLSNIPVLNYIFLNLGFLCVAVFFFISGYGLIISYKIKGDRYLNDIIPKKIFPLYFLCLVISFGYCVIEKKINVINILKLFYNFGEYGYLWYFSSILLFYLVFFLIYKFRVSDKIKFILMTIIILSYCSIVSVFLPDSPWKIWSSLSFILGYSWVYIKEDIDEFLKKKYNYYITFFSILILFLGLMISQWFYGSNIFLKMFSSCLFVVVIVMITYKISISNPITRFLGVISLELYAFQYLIMAFYNSNFARITNIWLYILLVLITTILFATIIHPLIKIYMKYAGKMFCKIRDKLIRVKNN